MPVNPVTNEEQGTLFSEFDIKVNRAMSGSSALRVSDNWLTNGVWGMKRQRVSNQTIFTCACCLGRDTGQNYLTNIEDYVVEAMFNLDTVMERWTRTEHQIEVMGTDFTRYISDAGQVCYIRRDYQEHLGLQYVYGDNPESGLWDNLDLDEASIVIAAHRDPQHVRLQLRDLLAASNTEEVNDDPLDDTHDADASLPQLPETPVSPTLRNALNNHPAEIGDYAGLGSAAATLLLGSRLSHAVELPDGVGVMVAPQNAPQEVMDAFPTPLPLGVGSELNGSRIFKVTVIFNLQEDEAQGTPVVISRCELHCEPQGGRGLIMSVGSDVARITLCRVPDEVAQDELAPMPTQAEPEERAGDPEEGDALDAPFTLPARPTNVAPIGLSEDLFGRIFASAQQATEDPSTWRVHRVNSTRIVPLVADGQRGEIIALRCQTENQARNSGGAVRSFQSGTATVWVSENSPRMVLSADDGEDAQREWMIPAEGREDVKVVFMPDWNVETHYVAVFLTDAHSVVRYVPLADLPERTNDAVRTLLTEVVRQVIAEEA